MNKTLKTIVTILAVGGVGYFLYRKWKVKKIDETPVSYNDALAKLEQLKKDNPDNAETNQ